MDNPNTFVVDDFTALTLGILVYFIGANLTQRFRILREWSIPEPVSGGLLAALIALAVVAFTGKEIQYQLDARDVLLVYFFTTVGLNASFADLKRGGPALGLMLALTVGFMVIQAGVGMLSAKLAGLPAEAGVMLGTASLIGGHGTAIAWGPTVAQEFGVNGAAELGIAMATIGLILASLLGGPVAKILIERKDLAPDEDLPTAATVLHEPDSGASSQGVTHVRFMQAIFWIHVAIIIGYSFHESLLAAGVKLPLFVPCLLAGIALSNTLPKVFKRIEWPAGGIEMRVVGEFSLSVFLSMSLMSMELWTLKSSIGALAIASALQATVALLFVMFVVFPLMGRNYFAGVLSAGFTGFTLGATPTAIANMTAVTQRYGPSPLAFIVLPLISAFFVDLANAFIIQWFLSL